MRDPASIIAYISPATRVFPSAQSRLRTLWIFSGTGLLTLPHGESPNSRWLATRRLLPWYLGSRKPSLPRFGFTTCSMPRRANILVRGRPTARRRRYGLAISDESQQRSARILISCFPECHSKNLRSRLPCLCEIDLTKIKILTKLLSPPRHSRDR